MTQLWAYVGDLGPGGALDWGGDWNGNIPKRRGDLPDLGAKAWSLIVERCRNERPDAKRTDWGAYALRVNGPELMTFLGELYGADARDAPAGWVGLARELGAEGYVALVAAEL